MKKLICAALAAMSVMSVFAEVTGKVVRKDEGSAEGTITYNKRDSYYEVKKGKVSQQIPLADVDHLEIPKPSGFDNAVKAVESGKGASAIGTLSKIVADYKMLDWDKKAARYLVEAYLSTGNAADVGKALDVADSVIKDDKEAAYKGDMAPAYWKALLAKNKMSDLDKCLKNAVTKGDRASAASAKVMEGRKLLKNAGSSPSQDVLKEALTSSFLRVALMYKDEPCRLARKEALIEAANCFEKLGHATRAANLRAEAESL